MIIYISETEFRFWSELDTHTPSTYGNAQANGFCSIAFLQLEINPFFFVFLQLLYWIPDLFRENLGG